MRSPPDTRALIALGLLSAALSLQAACGVPRHAHREALKDAEDARVNLARVQSRAILLERDLEQTRGKLDALRGEVASLTRENQRLKAELGEASDAEIIAAMEGIVEQQDALMASLRKTFAQAIARGELSLSAESGYVTLRLPSASLFDAKGELSGAGSSLWDELQRALTGARVEAIARCRPAQDAASLKACAKHVGALWTRLQAKPWDKLSVVASPGPRSSAALIELTLLPDLSSLAQEQPAQGALVGDQL